jgi:signal transduction histidine kinase
LKHAGGGRTSVTLTFEAEALGITIDDERGSARAAAVESAHEGRGLLGMRERVGLFGGTFDAAPTATGFRVVARLPIDGRAVAT